MLWDPTRRHVGIRPVTKKDQRAYRLAYGKKGNGAGFSAKTFMDHIGYDYSESRSTPVRWDEGESMFIAEVPMEYLRAKPQHTACCGTFICKKGEMSFQLVYRC